MHLVHIFIFQILATLIRECHQ